MPRYDQRCLACDWEGEVFAKPFEAVACPTCGGATEHVWTATRIQHDEIPGGTWIENLGSKPLWFDSKSEIVKEAKRRGLEPMVRHVPVPGTDKSPHTTSWAVSSPYQLEQARILLERVGGVPPDEEAEPADPQTEAVVADLAERDGWTLE